MGGTVTDSFRAKKMSNSVRTGINSPSSGLQKGSSGNIVQELVFSKTIAEKKAWEIVTGSNETGWTLTAILPSLVTGPGLKYHPTSESNKIVKSLGSKDPNMIFGGVPISIGTVDIRDVAAAHITAAFWEGAKGERYLITNESLNFAGMGTLIAKKYAPEYPIVTKSIPSILEPLIWLVAPYTGQGIDRKFVSKNFGHETFLDNSRSKDELGMEYMSPEQSLQEMYQQMIDNGAISKA